MKPRIRMFDEAVAKVVGHIPGELTKGLIWLGRFTTPLVWLMVTVLTGTSFFTNLQLDKLAVLVLFFLPLASLLKLFIRRKRPPTIYASQMKIRSYSFPSSHAYSAALAGGYVAQQSLLNDLIVLAAAVIGLIVIIGTSRIRIGAHYPSDVLAGWVLGGSVFAALLVLA